MKHLLKTFLKNPKIQIFLAYLGALYIRFVFHTTQWHYEGLEILDDYNKENRPFIGCFWHSRLAMLPCLWRWKRPFCMLLSGHRDGQLIGRVLKNFGIGIVSGSSTRGGTQAARNLIHWVKEGAVIGITPDGPRGPACTLKNDGVALISKLTKADVICASYAISNKKILKTWDSFCLPLPFSKGVFYIADPIPFPTTDTSIDAFSKTLQDQLNEATALSDELLEKS
jgi:lysophospholipid acyltransferase (LPLAT)-like uncharacterized protein